MYRFMYEVESGSTLKLTCAYDCPEAFGGLSSRWTACALSYMTINHNKTNRLFSNVIRGTHPRRGNKGKVGFSMLEESIGHVFGMFFDSLPFLSKRLGTFVVAASMMVFLVCSKAARKDTFEKESRSWMILNSSRIPLRMRLP